MNHPVIAHHNHVAALRHRASPMRTRHRDRRILTSSGWRRVSALKLTLPANFPQICRNVGAI